MLCALQPDQFSLNHESIFLDSGYGVTEYKLRYCVSLLL